MEARSVSSSEYYWNYHGQRIDHLNAVHASLRESCCKSFVWLAGDSSLDNKHWLFNGEKSNPSVMRREEIAAPAVNGYEHILSPPRMARDVCYWLNVGLHTARQARKCDACSSVALASLELSGRHVVSFGCDSIADS
mmetsp:Transcript_150401/g.481362  ORF Transcript_150401/g.481362 Transcript_150401/m.481362 type:complete len:137 (-) Transcript_150401:145-555(-)